MNPAPALLADTALDLEARVIALEREMAWWRAAWAARPGLAYCGVYDMDRTYGPGDAVSYGGSLWIAKTVTTTPPGHGPPSWQLAVKRGRDGKDANGQRPWSNDREE